MSDSDDDYWFQQRYDDAFYDLHGHLNGVDDPDCSLCGDTNVE